MLSDLSDALRQLAKAPLVTAAARLTLALALGASLTGSWCTGWLPARRSTKVDPLTALCTE